MFLSIVLVRNGISSAEAPQLCLNAAVQIATSDEVMLNTFEGLVFKTALE